MAAGIPLGNTKSMKKIITKSMRISIRNPIMGQSGPAAAWIPAPPNLRSHANPAPYRPRNQPLERDASDPAIGRVVQGYCARLSRASLFDNIGFVWYLPESNCFRFLYSVPVGSSPFQVSYSNTMSCAVTDGVTNRRWLVRRGGLSIGCCGRPIYTTACHTADKIR